MASQVQTTLVTWTIEHPPEHNYFTLVKLQYHGGQRNRIQKQGRHVNWNIGP